METGTGKIKSVFVRAALTLLAVMMTTATARAAKTIELTSDSTAVTLYNGDVLTGTGGLDTYITIVDGATVTLSGVTIATTPDDYNHKWVGICCAGDAVIILADGTTNDIMGGYCSSAIFVPPGKTVTIRGNGSLIARGSHYSAGIGCGYGRPCGNIVIEGGNITAIGQKGAGIGGSNYANCGDITITGGTVNATGGGDAAGIGCGPGASCGRITITSDVTSVTATAGNKADAIGVGAQTRRYKTPLYSNIIIGDVYVGRIQESPFTYNPSETGTTYTVHFDKNNDAATGTMADQQFTSNIPQALTPCAFTWDKTHTFEGWNTAPDGSGKTYHDEQGLINAGDMTLYAQWNLLEIYAINYVDAIDDWDGVTNTNPTSYNYDSPDITLVEPTRLGYEFIGWTYDGQDEPIKTVTIPHGSTGRKTFTAHWSNTGLTVIESSTGKIVIGDGQKLSGKGGSNTEVIIADGATVTLTGVDINERPYLKKPGITCEGNATIILEGDNYVRGGEDNSGIYVPEGKTLTIRGNGSLTATGREYSAGIGSKRKTACGNIIIEGGNITATGGKDAAGIGGGPRSCGNIVIEGGTVIATGGEYAAGIGGGSSSAPCGNITIMGGTITATGGKYSAGIGSGNRASCGNITVTRGVTSLTAIAGENAPFSIGAGKNSSCGNVFVGGNIGAVTISPFTYTPTGLSLTSTVHFDNNGGSGSMPDWNFTCDGTEQTLPACTFTAPEGKVFSTWNTKADGSGFSLKDGQTLYDIPDLTLYAQWCEQTFNINSLPIAAGDVVLTHNQILTGDVGKRKFLFYIADGATVTLNGVNINRQIASITTTGMTGITCLGNATIILADNTDNFVKGGTNAPGIYVPEGKTLTIHGNGSLTATGGSNGAGIGSNNNTACGNIVIDGGNITATGGSNGAGIGSGHNGSCGNITITGGTITATGGQNAAGIGGADLGSCGNIYINGGAITATGGKWAAGIGSGHKGTCGEITIAGGTVTATSGKQAAGIGSGYSKSSCGEINILEGVTSVTATRGEESPYIIGAGVNSTCDEVTVDLTLNDITSGDTRTITKAEWTGTGEVDDPYIIRTNTELLLMAKLVNSGKGDYAGKYYELGADIDFIPSVLTVDNDEDDSPESNFPGIGYYIEEPETIRPFTGHFNGRGHTISGIRLNKSTQDNVGLFGWIGMGGVVTDVTLADAFIAGYNVVGGIAGLNGGTITNCRVKNDVTVQGIGYRATEHGGVAGNVTAMGKVTDCTSAATLDNSGATASRFVGGITGYSDGLLARNLVLGTTVPKASDETYGAIAGYYRYYAGDNKLDKNYYSGCTVAKTKGAAGVGIGYYSDGDDFTNNADITDGDGAVNALRDDAGNSTAISQMAAVPESFGTYAVSLSGRKLFKDGAWNTLCLPFEVSTTDSPLAGDGVEAMVLNTTESKLTGTTLTLYFDAATVIPAGTPFIIRWNNTGATIENPVFTGVTVNATAPTPVTSNDGKVSFVGSYSHVALTPNDKSNLFLGGANTLYYPNDANNADGNYYVNAFRAFFSLDPTATVKEFKLNFGDSEDATSIDSLTPALSKGEGDIYNLAGQRLSKMQHGIYIVNGNKIAIK